MRRHERKAGLHLLIFLAFLILLLILSCSVAWSSTGIVLVSGDSDGMLSWWDVEREECVRVLRAHQGMVQCLRVSPDGSRLASCSDDVAITLWNLNSGEYLRTLRRD